MIKNFTIEDSEKYCANCENVKIGCFVYSAVKNAIDIRNGQYRVKEEDKIHNFETVWGCTSHKSMAKEK